MQQTLLTFFNTESLNIRPTVWALIRGYGRRNRHHLHVGFCSFNLCRKYTNLRDTSLCRFVPRTALNFLALKSSLIFSHFFFPPDCCMIRGLNRLPSATEVRIQPQTGRCGLCDRQRGTGKCFFCFSLPFSFNQHSIPLISFTYHRLCQPQPVTASLNTTLTNFIFLGKYI
jgi:hypothetical protein